MTAPPAGALEACLALLIEQMDMLRDDFVSYSDGKPTVPFVVLREALIAALNAYDEARPALLAALRLREWIPVSERLPERDGLGSVLAFDADRPGKGVWLETIHPSWWGQFFPESNEWAPRVTHWMPLPAPPIADDLARVLEESATGGEAGSA